MIMVLSPFGRTKLYFLSTSTGRSVLLICPVFSPCFIKDETCDFFLHYHIEMFFRFSLLTFGFL